jgi:hypothetical protein
MVIMDESKRSRVKNIIKQIFFSALVVLIFWLIFRKVPFHDVVDKLKTIEPVRFFITSILFVLLTLLVDAYTHFVLFKEFKYELSFKDVLAFRTASMLFVSLGFLYGQGGMALLTSRWAKRGLVEVAGLLFFLFFNTLMSAVVLTTIGALVFLPWLGVSHQFIWVWGLVAPGWIGFVAWVLFWKSKYKKWVPAKWREGILRGFNEAPLKHYLALIFWRSVQFTVISVMVWLAMPSVKGLDVPFRALSALLPAQGIMITVPTPGRYGVNEGSFLFLFNNWGDKAGLVAFSFLWGTCSNILRALVSLPALRKFSQQI